MAGPRGLMDNPGEIISLLGESKQSSLYLVGNPVIANKIISIDIRGSFYVPFRGLPLRPRHREWRGDLR